MSSNGTSPGCPYCGGGSTLVTGEKVLPQLQEVADRHYWLCDAGCDAYVGCHPGTTVPLGTLADRNLRLARRELHQRYLDPIWQQAIDHPAYAGNRFREWKRDEIIKRARERTYEWLGEQLRLPGPAHVGHFDLETCGRASEILSRTDYVAIRAWAERRKKMRKLEERNARRLQEEAQTPEPPREAVSPEQGGA